MGKNTKMSLGKYNKRLHVHWDDQLVSAYRSSNASKTPPTCLDLGCGQGLAKPDFVKLGYKYFGMDIAHDNNVSIIGDAHYLPFADESFDIVYSTKVLEHLPKPWKAMDEIYRVLKSGGYFFGSVAFIERFHSSYFHFTHYGVRSIIENAGLKLEVLEPGYLGTVAIFNSLFKPLRLGWIVELPTKLILFIRSKFAYIYALLRHSRNTAEYNKILNFLAEERCRFSGEFSFLAVKPGTGKINGTLEKPECL